MAALMKFSALKNECYRNREEIQRQSRLKTLKSSPSGNLILSIARQLIA
ncbi:MAG: hypothetical protein R8G34_13295 [Paracoccaceae bacterium]|nr:hypothetical protein [Paracoccaceae bacterium]